MESHPRLAKIALGIGVLMYVDGVLMMCYCPWTFAIAAVAFAITAATASGQRLRWFALACVAASVGTSVQFAKLEAKWQTTVQETARQNEELNKSPVDRRSN